MNVDIKGPNIEVLHEVKLGNYLRLIIQKIKTNQGDIYQSVIYCNYDNSSQMDMMFIAHDENELEDNTEP